MTRGTLDEADRTRARRRHWVNGWSRYDGLTIRSWPAAPERLAPAVSYAVAVRDEISRENGFGRQSPQGLEATWLETSSEGEMRDGIVIKEHRHWNTKQVWNQGHLMMSYARVPKTASFRSRLVNDANQDLCGGWRRPEHQMLGEGAVIVERVLAGLKPLGSGPFWGVEAAQPSIDWVAASGLPYTVFSRVGHFSSLGGEPATLVEVCQRGTVSELFDLPALVDDYLGALGERVASVVRQEVLAFGTQRLESFLGCWEAHHIPAWLRGLILGYPLENTISICYGGVGRPPLHGRRR